MNRHLQQCPYANVQQYDDTELWHCVPIGQGNVQETLHHKVASSSVHLGKSEN